MTKRYKWHMDVAVSESDWLQAKSVFVKSFHKYPLYVHLEPNDTKRPEFLRRYFEANYDVAVRHGKGILMVLRCQESEIVSQESQEDSLTIGGALLFVPPADDGIAWALQDDNLYWEAYKKYKLAEVSPGCLQRVIEYESWEQERVTKLLRKARFPMWNGLFCAIDPDLCTHGLGSVVFQKTVEIMLRYQKGLQPRQQENIEMSTLQNGSTYGGQNSLVEIESDVGNNNSPPEDAGFFRRLWNILPGHSQDNSAETTQPTSPKQTLKSDSPPNEYWMKFLHGLAMLHHMPVPNIRPTVTPNCRTSGVYANKQTDHHIGTNLHNQDKDLNENGIIKPDRKLQKMSPSNLQSKNENIKKTTADPPVIAAISHSSMASHFYAKNGFHHVVEIPYKPENSRDDPVPFQAHVLLMDPLKTGKVEIISGVFRDSDEHNADKNTRDIPNTSELSTNEIVRKPILT